MGERTSQQHGAHIRCSDISSKKRDFPVLLALGSKWTLWMNEQHGPPQGKPHLLIHDYGEFAEHVLIMGPQFFLVLQLVFLDEAFIHVQGLPTRICKLPLATARSKLTTSHRDWPLKVRLLIDCHPEGGWSGGFLGNSRLLV